VAWVVTADVVMVNVAEVFPAAIVTEAGVTAEALLLASVIDTPPAGAALPIVTVAVELLPPTNDAGFRESPVTDGGLIVNVPLAIEVAVLAVTIACT